MRFEAPRQIGGEFSISKDNIEPARNALRELLSADDRPSLHELMWREGWSSDDDYLAGGVNGIWMLYPYTPRETDWFNTIAPYVDAGSHIDLFEHDNVPWRIAFDGNECKVVKGEIVYPE